MITWPDETIVAKPVPKNRFLPTADSKAKKEFELIEKIIWQNRLSTQTLNLPKTKKVEEIQLFSIILRQKLLPKYALKAIQKPIPYPLLFRLEYGDEFLFATIYDKELLSLEWNEEPKVELAALDLQALYENIVKAFLPVQRGDFQTSLELYHQIKTLQKEITALKSKIKKEKQFKYKVELNKKLHALEQELERLKETDAKT